AESEMVELPGQIIQVLERVFGFSRRCLFRVISTGPLPTHLAFIMDGNRRYAKKLGLQDGSGHKAGFSSLMSMLQYCYELGIKYVTIYAFSIDNFRRRPEEVQSLMDLMLEKIKSLLEKESIVHQYGVRVYFIGNLALLSDQVRAAAEEVMKATAKNSRVVLLVCVAYNSTDEILQAVKRSCVSKLADVEHSKERIRLVDIEENMQMSVAPDPDVLIRSSGETRLSNFLLWQTGNSQLLSPDALWPEIGLRHLVWAVLNFQRNHSYLEKKKKQFGLCRGKRSDQIESIRRGNVSQTLAVIYSKFQRSNCTLAEGAMEKCSTIRSVIDEDMNNSVDTSKWKKVRASDAGIRNSMVPDSPMNVLRLLRRQGFDAYLVGGCVRDLLLHRAPKDYDVITTANLKQIRKLFHRAQVIGKRFPICHVWMGGSIIEVSSFDTVAQSDSEPENDLGKSGVTEANKSSSSLFKMYSGWDVKDCSRWRNSLQRDFTVNSLFYDPFEFKVYDYNNGMEDLKDLKLRSLRPAHLSFSEDSARILRGLRIAARLGLSISEDIETAIPEFISSVANLGPFRIILEMNYMLAYGAAAPSILLLMKYKLLHVLLPFQAAYLDQASKVSLPSSLMLVRLFSNMDKLVSCEQPADSRLWIALLAFHIALVRSPQEAIVLRAFASLLYHRNWSRAVKFAREHEDSVPGYSPEVSKSSRKISDEDLAEAVSEFTSLLRDTRYVLTDMEALHEALYLYPDFKFSGLVFVPKKKGKDVADWYGRLGDVETYESKKEGFSIDYISLAKGVPCEIGFVLGKIILDTIIKQPNSAEKKQSAVDQAVPAACVEKKAELVISEPSEEDNNGQAPVHGLKALSISKARRKILKRMRENSEDKKDQETEVCEEDSTFSGQAKSQDQSVVQKPKRKRKEALAPEAPKQKTSKRSKSAEQETVESLTSPAEKEHETVVQKDNKRGTKPPVSDLPKKKISKNRLKETQKVKRNDMDVKEIQDAKPGFVSDKSMSDLLKVLVKPSQQASSKEESNSLSTEKTKRPRKLSSLFR
ncbi:unnamed protein product, partial [Thlaspi arvense]